MRGSFCWCGNRGSKDHQNAKAAPTSSPVKASDVCLAATPHEAGSPAVRGSSALGLCMTHSPPGGSGIEGEDGERRGPRNRGDGQGAGGSADRREMDSRGNGGCSRARRGRQPDELSATSRCRESRSKAVFGIYYATEKSSLHAIFVVPGTRTVFVQSSEREIVPPRLELKRRS